MCMNEAHNSNSYGVTTFRFNSNNCRRPQISEWIVSTYLAFHHQSKLLAFLDEAAPVSNSLVPVPRYLENQHEEKWVRSDIEVDDSVGRTM
jgi:hypothetical protein